MRRPVARDQGRRRDPAKRFVPLLLLLLPVCAASQPRPGRPTAQAVPVGAAPTLDGNVLGDPAWADAPIATDFWQTTPDDGAAASERTEVRIVYTATTLYIGVVRHDRTPTTIVASDSPRRQEPPDPPPPPTKWGQTLIIRRFRWGNGGFLQDPGGIPRLTRRQTLRRETPGGEQAGSTRLAAPNGDRPSSSLVSIAETAGVAIRWWASA